MSRICARPGCASTASASLTYAYGESIVWMADLAIEAHPMIHDMCSMHAERVRVPLGWTLEDTRGANLVSQAGQDTGQAGALRLIGA